MPANSNQMLNLLHLSEGQSLMKFLREFLEHEVVIRDDPNDMDDPDPRVFVVELALLVSASSQEWDMKDFSLLEFMEFDYEHLRDVVIKLLSEVTDREWKILLKLLEDEFILFEPPVFFDEIGHIRAFSERVNAS